ncbi:MAG: hypothetical protein M3011_06260, partial [Actinomycetota bacterium]|nr:hypothetical protein [Actinomycetota bacterium]
MSRQTTQFVVERGKNVAQPIGDPSAFALDLGFTTSYVPDSPRLAAGARTRPDSRSIRVGHEG